MASAGAPPELQGMRALTRIGVALAGGGPLGAIYELGALCAGRIAELADCDTPDRRVGQRLHRRSVTA